METNQEMQQLITTVVRKIEEGTYADLVSDGMESTSAFEYALNTSWDLPEEVEESDNDILFQDTA